VVIGLTVWSSVGLRRKQDLPSTDTIGFQPLDKNTVAFQPFDRPQAPIPRQHEAIIYQGFKPGIWNLYGPALATLHEAFEGLGINVTIAEGTQSCQIIEDVRQMIQRSISVIVVSLGWICRDRRGHHNLDGGCGYFDSLRTLGDLGAYVILYNTEPSEGVQHYVLAWADHVQAQEVWTYSYWNYEFYKTIAGQNESKTFIARYFPPGCAKLLDVGVKLDAADRELVKVAFAGDWKNKRTPEAKKNYSWAIQQSPVVAQGQGLSTPDKWRAFLEKYPLQLNVHSDLNPGIFEAFRASVLLTNWACILSAPSMPMDEERFAGVVHFGWPQAMRTTYEGLRGSDAAIRGCQTTAHDTYCSRFSPLNLIVKSGFATTANGLSQETLQRIERQWASAQSLSSSKAGLETSR